MSALSVSAPPSPEVDAFREDLRIVNLIERKFRALEQLVFVLKKKVLTFESNEELCDRYVCTLSILLVRVHLCVWDHKKRFLCQK
jgi:hypothetical protein